MSDEGGWRRLRSTSEATPRSMKSNFLPAAWRLHKCEWAVMFQIALSIHAFLNRRKQVCRSGSRHAFLLILFNPALLFRAQVDQIKKAFGTNVDKNAFESPTARNSQKIAKEKNCIFILWSNAQWPVFDLFWGFFHLALEKHYLWKILRLKLIKAKRKWSIKKQKTIRNLL